MGFKRRLNLTTILRHYLIIPLLFISTLSWSADNKASVSYMEGNVSESRDGKDWKPISKGDTLTEGESVKTGAKSRLELTLPDGSKDVRRETPRECGNGYAAG